MAQDAIEVLRFPEKSFLKMKNHQNVRIFSNIIFPGQKLHSLDLILIFENLTDFYSFHPQPISQLIDDDMKQN